jgi:hypothetical protein
MTGQSQAESLCATQYIGNLCPSASSMYEPPFWPKVFVPTSRQFFRNTSQQISLDPSYVSEIQATASMITSYGAHVTILMKSDFNANRAGPISSFDNTSSYYRLYGKGSNPNSFHTSIMQYGLPQAQVQDAASFQNFNPAETWSNLKSLGLESSLQGLVLSQGGLIRAFQIQDIIDAVNGPKILDSIYSSISAIEVSNCTSLFVLDPVDVSIE